jgi:hypothetical protein
MKPRTKNYSKSNKQNQLFRLRQQIAVESARLISEEGIDNFRHARQKAAHKLGIINEHAFPDNEEILEQLKIHQSLFQSDTHIEVIKSLRETALKAMKLFQDFHPRLTGSVLLGHASQHSGIDIQLKADASEDIAMKLLNHGIPYQLIDWKLYLGKNSPVKIPAYQFYADNHKVNLITLKESQWKITPLSPLNGQPMQKASIKQLEALLKIN